MVDMVDAVKKRLESLGCVVGEDDGWIIDFVIEKVREKIKNECNVDQIPDGLFHVAVEMACGEYLSAKKGSGQLTEFDVDEAVKQIKEGDTTVTYAIADGAITLDGLINLLIGSGSAQFVRFRRLAW